MEVTAVLLAAHLQILQMTAVKKQQHSSIKATETS
jgi:hypothetical protein